MKQFNSVIENMAEQEEEWDPSQLVTFQQAGSILASMGFLQENVTPEHPDYALFEEIWELMEGTAREGVKVDDLAYVLKVIRGFRDSELEVECEAPEDKHGIFKMTVFDDEGLFFIRKGGQTKIANRYRSFYINKLQSESKSAMPRVGKAAESAAEKEMGKKVQLSKKTL